jgi:hypothetical protein
MPASKQRVCNKRLTDIQVGLAWIEPSEGKALALDIADLQRQLAAAKLDGERLDWIEKQEPSTINETKSCGGQWAWVVYQDKEESLREAVDAARQKEGK